MAGLAGLVAGAAALSGCKSLDTTPNVGPCPVAATLYDFERQVEIKGEERHSNVGFTGQVEHVRGFCRYVDDDPITMEVDIDFALGRGPAAEGTEKTYTYFVAVTRKDNSVLVKKTYPLKVSFKKGQEVLRMREKVEGIEIPRATPTISGANFEILVGFELTPEQLEFNRAGKRFRMQVEEE